MTAAQANTAFSTTSIATVTAGVPAAPSVVTSMTNTVVAVSSSFFTPVDISRPTAAPTSNPTSMLATASIGLLRTPSEIKASADPIIVANAPPTTTITATKQARLSSFTSAPSMQNYTTAAAPKSSEISITSTLAAAFDTACMFSSFVIELITSPQHTPTAESAYAPCLASTAAPSMPRPTSIPEMSSNDSSSGSTSNATPRNIPSAVYPPNQADLINIVRPLNTIMRASDEQVGWLQILQGQVDHLIMQIKFMSSNMDALAFGIERLVQDVAAVKAGQLVSLDSWRAGFGGLQEVLQVQTNIMRQLHSEILAVVRNH
ncbi:hypothetical protein BGZ54_007896 [Gamsiella multidivaricata]|nr:hypothetical protein BGZ54_007896 [Gamsiella multidivaricata]